MSILEVHNIEKHFGATRVLEDISFSLEEGQALAIIGSSGSGKTTLLRCLNFLETPDQGSILVKGKTLFDAADPSTQKEREIRKKRLHFGMVFQSFNLFPQYTALQNVTLASQLLAKERPDFKTHKKEIYAEIEAHGRELLAIYQNFACIGSLQEIQTPQQGGLAAAGRTDNGENLAFFQTEADTLQNLGLAKAFL